MMAISRRRPEAYHRQCDNVSSIYCVPALNSVKCWCFKCKKAMKPELMPTLAEELQGLCDAVARSNARCIVAIPLIRKYPELA